MEAHPRGHVHAMSALAMTAAMPSGAVPEQVRDAAVPAFEQLYTEHVAFLFRAARGFGVTATAAEDVIQDVFLVVHRRLPEFDGTGSLRAWLLRILVNVVREHRRRFRRRGDHDELEDSSVVVDPSLDPEERAALGEAAQLLSQILDAMSDEQREVFVLAEIEGVSVPEIAVAIQINVNTAYSRLRLARAEYESRVARIRAARSGRP
jgi:RNA polymerase sigma-70 factor (ECF subfamily)